MVFPKYLSNAKRIFNKILANSRLRIDSLKNILKISKNSQVLGGKSLTLGKLENKIKFSLFKL